jgi:glycosyltransferase involved in cell wall biosynthesis
MNVLFVADRAPPSFVHTDRQILQSSHGVDFVSFRWSGRNLTSMVNRVRRSDVVFGWFAGHHTYLATLAGRWMRKRVVIAAADYDLANEPSFDYGSMRGGVRAAINNHIFRMSDAVIVPSQFSYHLAVNNTCLKSMRDKLRIIPLGFADRPHLLNGRKERSVATVGMLNAENWIRKGHREFVDATSNMPDVKAYLVGALADEGVAARIRESAGPNISVTGFLSDIELDALLAKTKVYAQLSYMEGFGCSLAEAMLARCAPVVTRRGSLPEVVSDCGFYTEYGDMAATREAIGLALTDDRIGERARQRVLDCYPYERRSRELLEVVSA